MLSKYTRYLPSAEFSVEMAAMDLLLGISSTRLTKANGERASERGCLQPHKSARDTPSLFYALGSPQYQSVFHSDDSYNSLSLLGSILLFV
jgi:hypothetical protein